MKRKTFIKKLRYVYYLIKEDSKKKHDVYFNKLNKINKIRPEDYTLPKGYSYNDVMNTLSDIIKAYES